MLDDDDGLTGLMFGFCVVGNTKKHWNECRRQKFLLFYGYAYELCWIWISWLFMDCLGRRDEPTLPWAVRSQPLPPFLLSLFFSSRLNARARSQKQIVYSCIIIITFFLVIINWFLFGVGFLDCKKLFGTSFKCFGKEMASCFVSGFFVLFVGLCPANWVIAV